MYTICTLFNFSVHFNFSAPVHRESTAVLESTCSVQVYSRLLKIYTAIGYPAKFRVVLEKIIISLVTRIKDTKLLIVPIVS